MKKYGVVLVGCGYMGAAHINEIYYRDNINIVGVVDTDENKAKDFMRRYGALSMSGDYETYLKNPNVDIVIIATYPETHLSMLRKCIENNKHVLCEKPITRTIKEAKEFVELAEKTKTKVLVGHILRHNSTYKKVADMIDKDFIGSPIVIRMVQNKHTKDWERSLKLINNTSPIVDCGVHYIDIMQWFSKSIIKSVCGISAKTEKGIDSEKYNYGMFCVRMENGSTGYYEVGWGNTIASEDVKEFIGPKGRIRIVYRKDRNTHKEEGDMIEYYKYPENEYRIINIDTKRKPTWEQLQHLIKMIEENIDAIPSIREVYNVFDIALKADRAVKKGREILV